MTDTTIQMPDIAPLIRYLGDGTRTAFPYPFPIFETADLSVAFDGAPQYAGFAVTGAGETAGGTVTFTAAPAAGVVVTLCRVLALQRITDFIEGGDFSAQALNSELDYLTAEIQQVSRDQAPMLRYADGEAPANVDLPPKAVRAGQALGFDGDGNPIAVSLAGSMAQPSFTPSGTGAVTRTMPDKLGDLVSVKDFGAVGDGLTDCTLAIQKALAAHKNIFVPEGIFVITATLTVGAGQSLFGAGQSSVIKCSGTSFNALELPANQARIAALQIQGGATGIKLYGRDNECTQNAVTDVVITGAVIGIELDGYTDSTKPCYWNNFARVLVDQPGQHGVYLTKSGAGDTPNANRFHMVRVYSHGAGTTGCGFFVEYGAFNNAFTDCEANVNGPTAQACFRVGANSNKTLLVNLLTESTNGVPNVQLDAGSVETVICNLTSTSDGAAIYDLSNGAYDAVNAGYPYKNRLQKTTVTDLNATLMRFDTKFVQTAGTTVLDGTTTVNLVSAANGAVTIQLPNASAATGAEITVKKTDVTSNIVTVTETGGNGPDGTTLQLGGQNDYATLLSNGAEWYITASNRMAGNTRYADTTGTYQIDMAVDVYFVSSNGGAVTAQLPPANAAAAAGRQITIKKTDASANHVTVTEQGGNGPDQSSYALAAQYAAVTVVSDGGKWSIVSKYP